MPSALMPIPHEAHEAHEDLPTKNIRLARITPNRRPACIEGHSSRGSREFASRCMHWSCRQICPNLMLRSDALRTLLSMRLVGIAKSNRIFRRRADMHATIGVSSSVTYYGRYRRHIVGRLETCRAPRERALLRQRIGGAIIAPPLVQSELMPRPNLSGEPWPRLRSKLSP
jgi:hypothetical protein